MEQSKGKPHYEGRTPHGLAKHRRLRTGPWSDIKHSGCHDRQDCSHAHTPTDKCQSETVKMTSQYWAVVAASSRSSEPLTPFRPLLWKPLELCQSSTVLAGKTSLIVFARARPKCSVDVPNLGGAGARLGKS